MDILVKQWTVSAVGPQIMVLFVNGELWLLKYLKWWIFLSNSELCLLTNPLLGTSIRKSISNTPLCFFKDVTSWTSASKSERVFTGRPIKRLHHSAYSRRDFQYLGFSFPSVFKTLGQQYQKSLIRSLMEKMSFLWKPQMFYCCCLLHYLTINSQLLWTPTFIYLYQLEKVILFHWNFCYLPTDKWWMMY